MISNDSQIIPTLRSGASRPSVLTWLRLLRVVQRVDHFLAERLRSCDLSPAQFDVLTQVGAVEGMTQQELADSLLVTKGNICQLLDRMERAGLLERRQEGRANRIFLTEEGRALFDAAVPQHEDAVDQLMSGLNRAEQLTLLDLLRKLDQTLC